MVKKILLYVTLILFLMSGAMGALKIDSVSTSPSVIKPGDEASMTFRVQNVVSDNQDAKYSYKVKLEPKGELSRENVLILDGKENLGNLGKNEYWNANFDVKFKEGAPSSDYEFNLIIEKYLDGNLISSLGLSHSIDVVGETFFQVGIEDGGLNQGSTKNVKGYIENVGGASAGDVILNLANSDNVQVVGSNTFYFSNIEHDEREYFNLTLHSSSDIPSDTYNIPVSLDYRDGAEDKQQSMELGVVVGGDVELDIGSVETSPKEVRPGYNYVLMEVEVQNNGDSDAKSVQTNLKSDNFRSSYSDSNIKSAGDISSGESKVLKYYVDIPKNTESGSYQMSLDTSYQNGLGKKFNEELSVPLSIKKKPILEVENVSSSVTAGNSNKVRVMVTNTGEEEAEEVDLRLVMDSSLPFSVEERSQYLGTIDSGETSTGIFTIDVEKSASFNDYNLQAYLRARGDSEIGDNNIYTFNRDITLSVEDRAINKLAVAGVVVAVLVVLGIIGNSIYRRKLYNTTKKKSKK